MKVFELTSDVIKKHYIYFLYDHDSCISDHFIHVLKINSEIKSLSVEINEAYLEQDLNQYLSPDLFGEKYLIIVNIKNLKIN